MDDFYKQNILEHYRSPSYKGTLEPSTHTHEENNPVCGDQIRVDLFVSDDNIIDKVAFSGYGCAISQASASMLMEEIKGKSLEEAKQLDKSDILGMLGIEIGPVRMKCALLSLKVFKGAAYGLNADELDALDDDDDW